MAAVVGPTTVLVFFVLLAILGTILLAFGADRRGPRSRRAVLIVTGTAFVAVAVFAAVAWEVHTNTVRFSFRAALTPIGSGTVRVSLPVPVDGALIANLAASPSTSLLAMNRSGSESAIDATLTEATTLTASFSAYRYSGPRDLTRAPGWGECTQECNATVSVLVVSGDTAGVRIQAYASWSEFCTTPFWNLDAVALPGERAYPATWGAAVC